MDDMPLNHSLPILSMKNQYKGKSKTKPTKGEEQQ